ncbi:MAG: oligosaccharide flippase family protein [Patescibacteria group bacterium]|nr:oligosaccharide flippase family protein [Patescibacteria group bacterium]
MDKIKYLISKLYKFVFKQSISGEAKLFLKNLGIISIGYITSLIFAFLFQILAGRFLGPAEYGHFSLVNSVAMFLYIPMLMGISTALIKYNAKAKQPKEKSQNISSAYNIFFILSITILIILILLSPYLTKLLSVSLEIFYLSIAFAYFYALDTLSKATLRSLHQVKNLSFIYSSFGVIVLFIFLIFFWTGKLDYKSAVYATFCAYTFAIIFSFFKIFPYLKFKINIDITKKLLIYGTIGLMGAIASSFLANTTKILINKFLAEDLLGIYNAYHASSINLVYLANTMLMTVFFPTVAKLDSPKLIIEKIKKITPYVYIFVSLGVFIAQTIIIFLYGNKYPYDFKLVILFAITSALILEYGLYVWTFAAEGLKGLKMANLISVVIAIINLSLSFYLIPHYHLYGAILATLFSYLVGVIICLQTRNKFLIN